MKHLKLFENFDNNSIEDICKQYNIYDYTINSDGSIDVDGSVYLYELELTRLPLKFNTIKGNFIIRDCKYTTLEGCPKYVGGTFNCSNNDLNSLKYSPEYVGGIFNCSNNNLTSLEGCPSVVIEKIFCHNNDMETLIGIPEDFNGEFISNQRLMVIYELLKDNLEYVRNFYEYGIITNLKEYTQTFNWKRFIKFWDWCF